MIATTRRTTTKIAIAILSVAAIFAFSHNETYHRHLTESSTEGTVRVPVPVPVMHTFFHSFERPQDKPEEEVLALWKREWTNAGFDAKVLTMEDAKRHPDFEMVKNIMEPIHGENGYDALCFYRWLAMAASGGGWMSDHDTFPATFPMNEAIDLPNDGQFTTFQDHIPALMSGTAEQWDLMIKLLMMVNVTKSDMYAFEAVIHTYPQSVIVDRGSFVQHGFAYDSPHHVNCKKMANSGVVHLSHSSTKRAVKDGLYPTMQYIHEGNPHGFWTRAYAYRAFLENWKNQCVRSLPVSKS